ncbi:MAG TPA: hypothetical protein VKT33_05980 [Candidatus Angelobacter sp.]|nr:hypothetical protein [Candidatus Angelobacter sp.]
MSPTTFDIAIRVLCGLFAAGVMVYIFSPVRDAQGGDDTTRVTYLYERKDVVYENLRDLNFEFKSGKFTQADFDSMREGLEAEAARILAEIDRLESVKA